MTSTSFFPAISSTHSPNNALKLLIEGWDPVNPKGDSFQIREKMTRMPLPRVTLMSLDNHGAGDLIS